MQQRNQNNKEWTKVLSEYLFYFSVASLVVLMLVWSEITGRFQEEEEEEEEKNDCNYTEP